jgi:hypothetical protein
VLGPQPGFSQHLDALQQLVEVDPLPHRGLCVPPGAMFGLLPARLRQPGGGGS